MKFGFRPKSKDPVEHTGAGEGVVRLYDTEALKRVANIPRYLRSPLIRPSSVNNDPENLLDERSRPPYHREEKRTEPLFRTQVHCDDPVKSHT